MATISRMRLAEYLARQGLKAGTFARIHDLPRYSVHRWVKGHRRPNPEALRRLHEITGGQVTPNDYVLQEHREIPLTQERVP